MIIDPKTAAAEFQVYAAPIEDVELPSMSVDYTITDPPYDERTDKNARTNKGKQSGVPGPGNKLVMGFTPMNAERRLRWSSLIAVATRRHAIIFSDHESSVLWRADCERFGMTFVRYGLWVRTGDQEITDQRPAHSGAPQVTGDRPAQGHEVIVIMHSSATRMRWNGGGKAAVYPAPVVRVPERVHPTQKPLSLMSDIIRDFVRPGEAIWDPFCGAGTTLVAAKQYGALALGGDMDPKWADYSRRRVAGARRGA